MSGCLMTPLQKFGCYFVAVGAFLILGIVLASNGWI